MAGSWLLRERRLPLLSTGVELCTTHSMDSTTEDSNAAIGVIIEGELTHARKGKNLGGTSN